MPIPKRLAHIMPAAPAARAVTACNGHADGASPSPNSRARPRLAISQVSGVSPESSASAPRVNAKPMLPPTTPPNAAPASGLSCQMTCPSARATLKIAPPAAPSRPISRVRRNSAERVRMAGKVWLRLYWKKASRPKPRPKPSAPPMPPATACWRIKPVAR